MKKVLYGGLMMTALSASVSAMAAVNDSSLTTKGYVDSGLRAVYQVAKSAEDAIGTAGSGGNAGTGLIGRIESLESTAGSTSSLQQNLATLDETVNGDGVNTTGLSGAVSEIQQLIGAESEGGNPGSGILGDIETLQDQVAGKQNALTQTQQNAVDSGITSGLVTQIGTNAGDISGLQGEVGTNGDGTTLNSGTGLKGRISDLEIQMQNVPAALQSGNGVTISGGTASITGLDSTSASDGDIYILRNNQAEKLSIVSTWNASVLTNGQ